MKLKGLISAIATFSLSLFLVSSPVTAGANVIVYDNIAHPIPGNVGSVGYEATSTSEFGGQVKLNGVDRSNPKITVLMSSWGCESGNWNLGDCETTPGAYFSHPITLNIYDVGPDNEPGTLLRSSQKTFNIPYRPSANDSKCTGSNTGKWYDGTACYNGYATPISFEFSGLNLPDSVIISVAYNTSHHGNTPIGTNTDCYTSSGGCGYDSLNVGAESSLSIGTLPLPDDAYLNSSWAGAYCDGGSSGAGSFQLDAGCWTGYQPSFRVEVKASKVDICHKEGNGKYNLINVNSNALQAHLKHGDLFPGESNSSVMLKDDCSSWKLVDTITVPANNANPINSNITLISGQKYKIEASGEYVNQPYNVADAEYTSIDSWSTYSDGYDISPWFLGEGEFDLQINNNFVDWGAYNPLHKYSYEYTGTGSNVSFRIFDGYSDTKNQVLSWYGDNSGFLTVKIYK